MKNFYDDYTWSFLAASPSFSGQFFENAVVLLIEDGEDGSFGVMLNKPLGRTLGDANSQFADGELADVELFDGGPLSQDKINLAVCFDDGKNDGAFSFGIAPEKAEEIIKANPSARVAAFAGYSGWEPNQLRGEIAEGTWIVSNVDIDVMFDVPTVDLWKHIILRECPQFKELEEPSDNTPDRN